MSIFLYVDTETSDLDKRHIVQLACVLATETEEIASFSTLIRPDGWTIDPKAEAVHGISMERALRFGIGIETALWFFDSLLERADFVVAHNLAFDRGVIEGEYQRLGRVFEALGYCTMLNSMDHVGIRGKFGRPKWPSLQEAHIWATEEGFEGGHSADADTRACMRVHRKLLEMQ